MELLRVDVPKLAVTAWLYSFYTTIFALTHGIISAGILGIAFGVLACRFLLDELGW